MQKEEIEKFDELALKEKIFTIRNLQVMFDRDLAELYGVETRALNQAVKRNINRFPFEFMFQLTKEEFEYCKSQIAISNRKDVLMSQIVIPLKRGRIRPL